MFNVLFTMPQLTRYLKIMFPFLRSDLIVEYSESKKNYDSRPLAEHSI